MGVKETFRYRLVGCQSVSSYHCPEWYEVRREIPEAFRMWEQKARTSKKEWKWHRGIVAHPRSENQWNRGHFSMEKWKSEKHKSWCTPAKSFKCHVATDGSLPGKGWQVESMWLGSEWCSWTTMKRWGLCVGMYGSMEAEFEVQRTIKRADLTAFFMPSRNSDWTNQGGCRLQGNELLMDYEKVSWLKEASLCKWQM